MRLIKLLFRVSPGVFIVAIVTGLMGAASSIGLLASVNIALGDLIASGHLPASIGWALACLGLFVVTWRITTQALLVRLSEGAVLGMRLRLTREILKTPLRRLEEIGSPGLLAALTNDVLMLNNGLLVVPEFCINIAIAAGGLIYIGVISKAVLFVALGFIVVGGASYQAPALAALRSLKRARNDQDSLFRHFRSLTEGIKELKLHSGRRQDFLSNTLGPTLSALRRHNLIGLTTFSATGVWGQLLFFVFISMLLLLFPRLPGVTAQTLTSCVLTALFLAGPLESVFRMLPVLGQAKVALQKIDSLDLSLASIRSDSTSQTRVVADNGWVRLDLSGIAYRYHSERPNEAFGIGPISLSFVPGEVVFLVGGNGGGKTTFAKLIVGLYTPEVGEIRLGGCLITDDNREWYRQHFSAVFSDFYLFENLASLGGSEHKASAEKYLNEFGLDHKVQLEGGILTTTALSQGQRKRLALLTAFLENRDFYVFDEWAADQDPAFKYAFYTQLLPDLRSRGKCVLAITHDEKYFHLADRVIKMDWGKIESNRSPDEGTPEIPASRLIVAPAACGPGLVTTATS
jgi:putative ATP-binding cassette transporter